MNYIALDNGDYVQTGCPCCKNESLHLAESIGRFQVQCKCGYYSYASIDKDSAIKNWDERKSPEFDIGDCSP